MLTIANEGFEDDATEQLMVDIEPNQDEDEAHEMHENPVVMQDND